jgi:hypothetical protein
MANRDRIEALRQLLTHPMRSDQAADDATRIELPDLFGALIRSVIADESISADFKQIAAHHMDAIAALDPCG